jgi:HlyD family secretion protein
VEIAQTNLKRYQGLLAKGYVPQTQVDTAQNQLVAARSNLSTAQAKLDTLKADQAARLQDARSRVQSAQGSLRQARSSLASARTNTVQDTLKRKDVAAARAALVQAQAGLNSALANRKQIGLKAADVTAAESAGRQSQAALQGAQANTIQSSVKAEDVAQAQARVTRAEVTALNARVNLDQTRVEAPRDGIVLKKYVDEGTIIQSGQSGFSGGTAIVQLANVSRIYVDTLVDEADIALIQVGQKVDITLDAYPNSPKSGSVRKIFPEAETVTNVTYIHLQVEIDPMDVDERLRPLMNATCDFEVENKEDTLKVPSEAVKDEEDASVVTVIKDPKKPLWDAANQDKRTVEVGVRGDDSTEIISGLKEGDTVVTQIIEPVSATASSVPATGGLNAGRPGGGGGGGRGGGGGGGRGFR